MKNACYYVVHFVSTHIPLEDRIAYQSIGDFFSSRARKTIFDYIWQRSNIVSTAHHHFVVGIFNVFIYMTSIVMSFIYLDSLR